MVPRARRNSPAEEWDQDLTPWAVEAVEGSQQVTGLETCLALGDPLQKRGLGLDAWAD